MGVLNKNVKTKWPSFPNKPASAGRLNWEMGVFIPNHSQE
jgi:hypothetical protein